MGFIGGLPALFIGYIGLQISSNVAHGPLQGWLPDEVPAEQLGIASGIKTSLDMAGIILSSLLMGFLISSDDADPTLSILVIIGMLVIFGAITLVFAKEHNIEIRSREKTDWKALWHQVFNFHMDGDKDYWKLIFSRFLYLVGIYGFQSFAQYYIRDKFSDQDPIVFTQFVMGSFVVVLIIFSLISGANSDKGGRKRWQIASSIIGAFGAILLIFANSPTQLLIFGSIMGVGLGIFLSVNWALANQMAPKGDFGKYVGLTNLATAGSAAVARLEGPMIDFFNNRVPGEWWGWTILFAVSAVLMLLSALAIRKVNDPLVH